jgi:nitrite reductase (NADH) small subunit
MSKAPSKWTDIGAVEDIPVLGARLVKTPTGCIAVFRTETNEVFAMNDRCPHKGGPLSQGIVHGRSVTCPLHNWVIDLATGGALGADTGKVQTFAITLKAGRILMETTAIKSLTAA